MAHRYADNTLLHMFYLPLEVDELCGRVSVGIKDAVRQPVAAE